MPLASIVNSQQVQDALLWILEFTDHNGATVLRAVNNLEDVTSNGHLYTAFPFELTLPPDDGQRPQSLSLTFPNVSQDLVHLIREYAPGLNPSVKIQLILSSSPDTIEKTIDFLMVVNVTYDALTITFDLAPSSIFARKTMTATYNQAEFPGLFFALGAGERLQDMLPETETPDPEVPDPGAPTPPPPGDTSPVIDFEDLFGRVLYPDGRNHYIDILVPSNTFALKITIPTLTKPATFLAEERSTGDGAKRANLSDNQGFGAAGIIVENDNVGVGALAGYTFPAGPSRVVWLNIQQLDLTLTRMSASLSIMLR